MLKRAILVMAGLIIAGSAGAAVAQDLTGLWTGQVNVISEGQTKFHTQAGVRGTSVTVSERQGVETFSNEVIVRIDSQQGNVLAGSWSSGDAGFPFVCGLNSNNSMLCADETGYFHATLSGSTMDSCYVQAGVSGGAGKFAACGTLTKQ